MTDLAITTHTLDGMLRVAVSGEVDMANSDEIAGATHDPATGGVLRAIVVDLGMVSFMDSSGVRVLLLEQVHAREHGVDFRIANPTRLVRRVLEVTGVLATLTSDGRSVAGSPCPVP